MVPSVPLFLLTAFSELPFIFAHSRHRAGPGGDNRGHPRWTCSAWGKDTGRDTAWKCGAAGKLVSWGHPPSPSLADADGEAPNGHILAQGVDSRKELLGVEMVPVFLVKILPAQGRESALLV